jgi:hypothetical protein
VTNVLGFDDLADMSPVPAGYAGLNWSGLDTLSDLDPWFGSGYENGLVSPPNVVFNPYGGNVEISASNSFNLVSAYLTGGLDGMHVEVLGYVGSYLACDQTYALSESAPTLVTFNFLGVTDVAFIPEPMTQFVMDNLTVSGNDLPQLPPPSATSPPPVRRRTPVPWSIWEPWSPQPSGTSSFRLTCPGCPSPFHREWLIC